MMIGRRSNRFATITNIEKPFDYRIDPINFIDTNWWGRRGKYG